MGYYCGIDLGGTNIKAGIVDGEGKLLNKLSIKTRAERPMEEIIHDMGQLAADLCCHLFSGSFLSHSSQYNCLQLLEEILCRVLKGQ